jgi:hypothetical protein
METKKLDASKLKVGDFMSRIQYMKVRSINGDSCEVEDETGFTWTICNTILEAQAYSSHQFTKIEKVTRTELARIAEQDVRDAAMSCSFTKLPNQADQEKLLAGADISTPAKRKRIAKELGVGATRVMHCHITDSHELGRLPVFDLEARGERLVDLRSLEWLTYANTRYEVK